MLTMCVRHIPVFFSVKASREEVGNLGSYINLLVKALIFKSLKDSGYEIGSAFICMITSSGYFTQAFKLI